MNATTTPVKPVLAIETLLTAEETAEVLKCSIRMVHTLSKGPLPCLKVGRLKRFRLTDLQAFIAARK